MQAKGQHREKVPVSRQNLIRVENGAIPLAPQIEREPGFG
jgi:hypothetical protein